MKQENTNLPLWKMLNEQRPKIKFDVKAGDKNFMRIVGYIPYEPIPTDFKKATEQAEKLYTAAKYIDLAQNNLHILAEELENVLWNFEGKDGLTKVQQACIRCCKEALNRIS